jgi:hypothetical protein
MESSSEFAADLRRGLPMLEAHNGAEKFIKSGSSKPALHFLKTL